MGYLYALWGVYLHQLKIGMTPLSIIASATGAIAPAALLAWIGTHSDNPVTPVYVYIGIFLMWVWNWAVFWIGYSITVEFSAGTLDFSLVSRTPIMLWTLAKAMAATTYSAPSGVVACLTAVLVLQRWIEIANLPMLLVSFSLTILALMAVSLTFAPLMLLVRGREGFFLAIQPLGILLGGFLYPVSLLPSGLRVAAWFVPTSWAMDAIVRSAQGDVAQWAMASDWAMALTLSLAYVLITYFLLRRVEKRIRAVGDLTAY